MTLVADAAIFDMLEPLAQPCFQRLDEGRPQLALCRKFVETLDCRLDGLSASGKFFYSVGVAFAATRVGEPECAHYGGQHQALAHERHEDNRKSEEKNPIAVGKELAALGRQRNCKRRRERDNAADTGKRQRK